MKDRLTSCLHLLTDGGITALNSPRRIAKVFLDNFWHFICRGVLFGIGNQLDPDPKPKYPTLAFNAALWLAVFLLSPDYRLGIALIAASPLWLYILTPLDDAVMENRGYLSLFGLAVVAATLATNHPALVGFILVLFTFRTVRRSAYWQTRLGFWEQAASESPDKFRTQFNEAVHYSYAGENRHLTIAAYERIAAAGIGTPRERGTLASNLGLLYLQEGLRTQDDIWTTKAATLLDKATLDSPANADVRFVRGWMFERLGMLESAIHEYSLAVEHCDRMAKAFRQRGLCYLRLKEFDLGRADLESAEKIDGVKARINIVPRPEAPANSNNHVLAEV